MMGCGNGLPTALQTALSMRGHQAPASAPIEHRAHPGLGLHDGLQPCPPQKREEEGVAPHLPADDLLGVALAGSPR